MKHAKKQLKRDKQKKVLNILLLLLCIAFLAAAATIYRDYQARPGFLEKIWISERGADYLKVSWEKPRNVYRYVITYNGKTISVGGMRSNMKLSGLEEDTEYNISVRADSRTRKGFDELTKSARTKKSQSIEGDSVQMKFANMPVDLKMDAETDIEYISKNKNMKMVDGKLVFTRPGKYNVAVKTAETKDYVSVTKKITVNVLDTVNVDAEGASPHIFYKLNKSNCELVMPVTGVRAASVPQSFEYADGNYIILFVGKDDKAQRIITLGDKKTITKPKMDLGHCNGFTRMGDRFYEIKSRGPDGVSFDRAFNSFTPFALTYNASGISYDEKTEMFFVSQYSRLASYDKNFNVVNHFGRIRRNFANHSQDCGSYGGIMMHCVSGPNYHGTNYIDFYDMLNKKYLGTIECELDEVESLLVNEEGFIELLCNTKKTEDYIWKTPINIKKILG